VRFCKNCGQEFTPKEADRKTFCGRGCSYEYLAKHGRPERRKPPLVSILKRSCRQCGKRFTAVRNAVYCSDECRAERNRERGKRQDRTKTCDVCAKTYTVAPDEYMTAFCSDECRQSREREQRSAGKARRRARERTTQTETVSWLTIAGRDGYACNACGCDTPKALRGTHYDNAPELDHVVALAQGGTHTADNLQILCRLCNQMKSDKPMAEFMREMGLHTP